MPSIKPPVIKPKAERAPGSGHTRYHLSQTRKDTMPKKGKC